MARVFNGTSDKIEIGSGSVPSPLDISTDNTNTMISWIKITTVSPNTIIGYGRQSSTTPMVFFEISSGDKFYFLHRDDASVLSHIFTGNPGTAWENAAWVRSAQNSREGFQNGTSFSTNTGNPSTTTVDTLHIGVGERTSFIDYFTGHIAECAIFDITLTDQQVKAVSNGVPAFVVSGTKPIGYWPLWGIDEPEPDYSNQNNGIVTGATKIKHPSVQLLSRYM